MLTVGGLFSGIGGWELGLERAGMRVLWHCEADPYARAVLEQWWPGVPCYPDVRELRGADVEPIDVLCGGFPCQDLSYAGAGAGIDGARSGLWSEYARLVGELRPHYVFVENVSALLARGLGRVLGDLAALGYDAEWDCLPASAFGAHHERDRIWLVAYPARDAEAQPAPASGTEWQRARQGGEQSDVANSDCLVGATTVAVDRRPAEVLRPGQIERAERCGSSSRARHVADAQGARLEGAGVPRRPAIGGSAVGDADRASEDAHAASGRSRCAARESSGWGVEPDVGRVAHGVPSRVDRLACLGNALVPQIAEWIGRRVIQYEEQRANTLTIAALGETRNTTDDPQ